MSNEWTAGFGILGATKESVGAMLSASSHAALSPKEAKMHTKSIPALTPEQEEIFWSRVDVPHQPSCCWEWNASGVFGYGTFRIGAKPYRSHRIAYTLLIGGIPPGMVLDHRCRNHGCVNPDHLEVVTNAVNVKRGLTPILNRTRVYELKTHCSQGHEFTPENTWRRVNRPGTRVCRICKDESQARQRAAQRA